VKRKNGWLLTWKYAGKKTKYVQISFFQKQGEIEK
jgi:hypothetical protein